MKNKKNGETVIMGEIGERIAQLRLEQNLKQSEVAREAGIGLSTLQRLERGEVATRLSSFIRVCQVLGIMDRLDQFLPKPEISPMALMRLEEERPKRASSRRGGDKQSGDWAWGE